MHIVQLLYSRPVFKREATASSDMNVIRWWESRRMFFNLIVGCTGLMTCVLMIACGVVSEPIVGEAIGLPDPIFFGIFGVLLYGMLANIAYTCGWICETGLRLITSAERASFLGSWAFRAGISFSVVLTFAPAVLSWVLFGIAVMHGQTHGPAPE